LDRIVYLMPHPHAATGGNKVTFRHVEGLTALGYDAVIRLIGPHDPPDWFEHAAPVERASGRPDPGDILVLPEDHAAVMAHCAALPNRKVVFCLRGMKTNMGDPHRNFVDFAHVPVVKRLTRMPVCIDPSHSIGSRGRGPEGILDMMHVTAQGVIAGANMILVDFHPEPNRALVDGPQAMRLAELPLFLEDVRIAREAYERRLALFS
jgi:hypothetical protein